MTIRRVRFNFSKILSDFTICRVDWYKLSRYEFPMVSVKLVLRNLHNDKQKHVQTEKCKFQLYYDSQTSGI